MTLHVLSSWPLIIFSLIFCDFEIDLRKRSYTVHRKLDTHSETNIFYSVACHYLWQSGNSKKICMILLSKKIMHVIYVPRCCNCVSVHSRHDIHYYLGCQNRGASDSLALCPGGLAGSKVTFFLPPNFCGCIYGQSGLSYMWCLVGWGFTNTEKLLYLGTIERTELS